MGLSLFIAWINNLLRPTPENEIVYEVEQVFEAARKAGALDEHGGVHDEQAARLSKDAQVIYHRLTGSPET